METHNIIILISLFALPLLFAAYHLHDWQRYTLRLRVLLMTRAARWMERLR